MQTKLCDAFNVRLPITLISIGLEPMTFQSVRTKQLPKSICHGDHSITLKNCSEPFAALSQNFPAAWLSLYLKIDMDRNLGCKIFEKTW